MNGRRDIERTLDLWLVDGPSRMPDRLFDAVLDRVERTPQRRLARLNLRLTEMNPRIRLYTLAAAGLIVAVVGVYLFNRASAPSDVGSSPSPAGTPTAPASTAMPAVLAGIWIGGPRELTGFDADAGRVLEFAANGDVDFRQSANNPATRVRSTVAGAGPDRVTFVTRPGDPDCREADAGTYTWSISADGQTLTLTADGTDACPVRAAAVAGSWELVDCPTADDNCLGTIAAGSHASQFFDQEIGPGDAWTPRFGAIEYTVPDGWRNIEDWPDFYRLGPVDAADGTFVFLTKDIVAVSETDQCAGAQHPDIGTSAEELANWLATSPGLITTAPVPVTVGGLEGFRVDIRLDPAWTGTCPWSEGKPVREFFTDRPAAEGFGMGIGADTRMALYLLAVEADRAVLVDVEAATGAEFDSFVDAATTVVESLTFNP
jgi:hypothetical protein